MREIKFRAWAENTKEMFYGDAVRLNLDGHIASTYGVYDKKLILMQYTGLKDKNGVEIYEGDIIKTVTHSLAGKELIRIDVLKFNPYYGYGLIASYKISEVIGNTYENPELAETDNG